MDEPAAGLDLGAVKHCSPGWPRWPPNDGAATRPGHHHLEEIPPGVTHAALLRSGRLLVAGPVDEVLTDATVSDAFGVEVAVERRGGRWRHGHGGECRGPGRTRRVVGTGSTGT